MTTPKKPQAHPEDAAKAVFRLASRKPADLVVSTNQLLENVKKHPQYPKPAGHATGGDDDERHHRHAIKQDTDIQIARTDLIALMSGRGAHPACLQPGATEPSRRCGPDRGGLPVDAQRVGLRRDVDERAAASLDRPAHGAACSVQQGARARDPVEVRAGTPRVPAADRRRHADRMGPDHSVPEGPLHADGARARAEDRDPRGRTAEDRCLGVLGSAQRDRALIGQQAVHTGRPRNVSTRLRQAISKIYEGTG